MRNLHQWRGRGMKLRCSAVARACGMLRIDTPDRTWCTAGRVPGRRSVLFSLSSGCSFFVARLIEPAPKSRDEKLVKKKMALILM